jgi:glycerophosphoryl diester phosphodiesterase
MKKVNKENMNIFLKHLDRYSFIAHRLGFIMEGYPENSIDNIKALFNDSEALNCCNGFEFDIRFTKNHVPLVAHDFRIDDISEGNYVIGRVHYDKIENIKFGYRKSTYNSDIPWHENKNFNIQTLNDLLKFFKDNKDILGNRIIRFETKTSFLDKRDVIALKNILKKYSSLKNNIVHISFFPWNLKRIRDLQKKEKLPLTKTELLVDFYFEKILTRFWKRYIDGISLGVRENRINGNMKLTISTKLVAFSNSIFFENRNALTEKWLKKIINTYGYAGIYTINNHESVDELLSRISPEFLNEYADRLLITSDNPKYFKQLTK